MPSCNRCGSEHDTDELVRHEHDALVIVHCPDCNGMMGQYNSRRH